MIRETHNDGDLRWAEEDTWVTEGGEHSLPRVPPDLSISQNLRTAKLAACQGIFMVVHVSMTLLFKIYEVVLEERCDTLAVILFTQLLNWGVAFAFHQCYDNQHSSLRVQGYNKAYKRMSKISSYLFYLLTWWNAITILILALSISRAADEMCNWKLLYSAINLTIFCTIVFGLLFMCITIAYIRGVREFNRLRLVSDIDLIDVWKRELAQSATVNSGPEHEELIRVLERQSNIIEFYHTRNAKIMKWVSTKFNDKFSAK